MKKAVMPGRALWARAVAVVRAGGSGAFDGAVRTPVARRVSLVTALSAFWVLGGCGGGVSGEVGQACLSSGREAVSRQLCSCVQGVASQTLSPNDQRRAALFFDNPDRAEATRFSDRPSDDAFWERYQAFADTAEAICTA